MQTAANQCLALALGSGEFHQRHLVFCFLHKHSHLEFGTVWGCILILQFTQFISTLNVLVITFFSFWSYYIFFDAVSFDYQSTVLEV